MIKESKSGGRIRLSCFLALMVLLLATGTNAFELDMDRLNSILEEKGLSTQDLVDTLQLDQEIIDNYAPNHNLTGAEVLDTTNADTYHEVFIPSDWDNEPLDLSDFDFEKMVDAEWPPEVEWDYQYNVYALYQALNTFRMNISLLQEFVNDQQDKRMIDVAVNGMPPRTYACWDYYATLNPFGACNWRGLWRNGPYTLKFFERYLRLLKEEGDPLHNLEWNTELSIAAADYLKDLEGCRSIPDQIYHSKPDTTFVDDIFFRYERHHRVVLMPMRFPWINPLEAVFDLLTDDYYEGHPNRDALLSNDYDAIGIACNCHTRFGQICVFELASEPMHDGEVVSTGDHPDQDFFDGYRGDCMDQCFELSKNVSEKFPQYMENENLVETEETDLAQAENDIYYRCCDLHCGQTVSTCSVRQTQLEQELSNLRDRRDRLLHGEDIHEFYEFYPPYDPECPDAKRSGECLEVYWDKQPPAKVGVTNTSQDIAHSFFDEVNELRCQPQDYADVLMSNRAIFAAEKVEKEFTAPYYYPYLWNEGLARAARHYLNDEGACGTCGDINSMGFKQVLSAYYVWNYFGLEYEIFETDYWIDGEWGDNADMVLAHILTQDSWNHGLFLHTQQKEMGVGCACNSEGEYKCLVAVVDRAPVRDIKERIPTYQEQLGAGEECSDRCEWLSGSPDHF